MRRLLGWIAGLFVTNRPDVVETDQPNRRRRRVFLVRNAGGLMEAITKPGVPQQGEAGTPEELLRTHGISRPIYY